MSKHTPGPWVAADNRSPVRIVHQASADCIAMVYLTDPVTKKRDATHEANAKLIAAAPDLLAALQAVAWHLDARLIDARLIDAARAAIAKAGA